MKGRTFLWKVGMSIAPLVVVLAMGGPVAEAAGSTIIVDHGPTADDCGKYDGKPAAPIDAISAAAPGSTVLVCPGIYELAGLGSLSIVDNSKLTIKRALTGPGSRPILRVDPSTTIGLVIINSKVTIDGLIFDGSLNGKTGYRGIYLGQASATIKNTGLIGPDQSGSAGILSDATGQTKVQTLTITNSYIVGYSYAGVYLTGPVKLKLSSSYLDATDGGRVSGVSPVGVFINGATSDSVGATGAVTKCRMVNNYVGVYIQEASKVSVTNNTLLNNGDSAVRILTNGVYHSADNNKITGNTILGVPASKYGVYIYAHDPDNYSVKKTTISKNVIVAAQYTPEAASPNGIYVYANAPAATTVTVTISGNSFWGFPVMPVPADIVNISDNAGLTVKGNDALP